MHMQNNDPSNFWALSTPVLKKNLELIGFANIREVKRVVLQTLAEHMARIIVVARKPERPAYSRPNVAQNMNER